MTLLIAATTPQVIYQSSDYRLTNDGAVVSDSSAKLITLQFGRWFGFVTYTGIGSVGRRSTASFIVDWLKNKPDLAILDLVEILRERGSRWLRAWSRGQPHTFLFSGFEQDTPVIATVSNFEDLEGRCDEIAADEFTASMKCGRGIPPVVVCGMKSAVSRHDLRLLRRAIEQRADHPQEIRGLLREVNKRAAQSERSRGAISAKCSTINFRADGRGQYEPDGDVEVHSIMMGHSLDMERILADIGLKGRLMAASFGFVSDKQPFPPCTPQIVRADATPHYDLSEVKHELIGGCTTVGVSDSGLVVANGTPVNDPATNFVLLKQGELDLQKWDEPARAFGVNERQQIAAAAIRDSRTSVAVVIDYPANNHTILPARVQDCDSEARHINDAGNVAGRVTIDSQRREQAFWRPAAWIDGCLFVLDNKGFDWGYGVAIDDSDEVLATTYKGHVLSAVRWNPRSGWAEQIGVSEVVPLGMTRDGVVLGGARNEGGKAVAVTAARGGRLGACWDACRLLWSRNKQSWRHRRLY